MTNIWAPGHRDWNIQGIYGRINGARKNSPALRSQQNYFLARTDTSAYDSNITAIAKFQAAGVSAASQDVVFAFVNNNYWASTNRSATFFLNATIGGNNWFGIQPTHNYNIVDLMSTNPTAYIWGTNDTLGSTLIANGIFVSLWDNAYQGKQAQYLRLIDRTAGITPTNQIDYYGWDSVGDGIPDWWRARYFGGDGKTTNSSTCATCDYDGDGVNNIDEYLSGSSPTNANDYLDAFIQVTNGQAQVSWPGKSNLEYHVERTDGLMPGQLNWQGAYFGTALSTNESFSDGSMANVTNRFYRVRVQP